jgi:Putative polyhydroxyalkanoic acid system protein (PHA_gran_rgn)
MAEPLTVSIPHRLGKEEALRRIKTGLDRAKGEFAWAIRFDDERWEGDRLDFRVSALTQHAAGSITVLEDAVRVEVILPWLLARFAQATQRVIGQSGAKMLEKK